MNLQSKTSTNCKYERYQDILSRNVVGAEHDHPTLVGNVLDVEGPSGGGLMVYADGEQKVGIGPLWILLVHFAQPDAGHFLT
jgi:hypothetical protein